MDTPETQERGRPATVQASLKHALQDIKSCPNHYARDTWEQKIYLWESKADRDHAEKNSTRESIQAQQRRLLKLENSPYFGRFDFSRTLS
jgi:DNA helicase IV